jgi:Xaa-Pro aminopeptidase
MLKKECILKAKPNFLKLKRIIKTNKEIKNLSLAGSNARKGFNKFKNFLDKQENTKINLKEYELNFKAKEFLSKKGKYSLSFEPITAIETNSAKPHAIVTNKKLNKNDLVLFDGGIKYNNYCSDKTMTFLNKKNKNFKFQKKIYDIVQTAQDEAFKVAKEGIKACKVDKKAREVIDKAGFLKYFIHSTGHGVGLDIHELPFISKNSNIVLKENMVFTIEPGIYIPNKFGIRIEETFYIKNGVGVRI